jgi:hypothetical protein
MSEQDKIIWLVEDNATDAEQYEMLLERSHKLDIEYIHPKPDLADYSHLVSDPKTGAFLIDQRLGDGAGVPYSGIDLASFLRSLSSTLPLYILTNYPGRTEEGGSHAVDAVIDKKYVGRNAEAYVDRILRSISRYDEALAAREQRLRELIDRKIASTISEDEEKELAYLRADVERPGDLLIANESERWETSIREQRELLVDLQRIIAQLRDLEK